MTPSSFTCPQCHRTSHHPEDVRHGYCGACHEFTGSPHPPSPGHRGCCCHHELQQCRSDMNIRQGALARVLDLDGSTDYYALVEEVSQLRVQLDNATAEARDRHATVLDVARLLGTSAEPNGLDRDVIFDTLRRRITTFRYDQT